ncbi:hypothetical protein AVEN_64896-1 [Araneus ventricosus]|uniref:Immunoglobulin-like beta-sandwich domain-containing protein n=1 Tax=Araneus ventricosus TaxID=182803 RepID=A0A4Y2L2I9_ARAVE|nr:hypothetical protein AVEN_64896-1 [Araneus ventricosus]
MAQGPDLAMLRQTYGETYNEVVAWIHTDRYTLLTLQNRVITRNSRYKVTHNSHRTWWLHIADVQERDRGEYMCQINTSPMKSQTGYIEVVGENIPSARKI